MLKYKNCPRLNVHSCAAGGDWRYDWQNILRRIYQKIILKFIVISTYDSDFDVLRFLLWIL